MKILLKNRELSAFLAILALFAVLVATGKRAHGLIRMVELDPQRPVIALHHRGLSFPLLPERRLVQRHGVPADRRVRNRPDTCLSSGR